MAVRGWLWFALAFTLIVAAGAVKAETIAANSGYQWRSQAFPASPWQSSQTAACQYHCTNYTSYTSCSAGTSLTSCSGLTWNGTPFSNLDVLSYQSVLVCPSSGGWTLSGSNCVRPDCVAPEVRGTDGVCASPCGTSGATVQNGVCVCPGFSQDFSPSDKTCNCIAARLEGRGTPISGNGVEPATSCFGGCVVNHGGLSVSVGTGATALWSSQVASFTSTKCTGTDVQAKTPTEDTRTPEQKCLASGGGFITTSTGTVCTDSGDSPLPVTKKTIDNTVNKDGTGAVTGTESTETVCIGDQCTTTKTTKDANGNVTGTTITTGSGSGADSNGSYDGDEPSECEKFPTRIGCAEFGTPAEDGPLTTNAVGLSSLTPSLSAAGSCPADISLPRGMKFSWEYVCMYASGIRPVIIALAWLSAGFLLFGMRLD